MISILNEYFETCAVVCENMSFAFATNVFVGDFLVIGLNVLFETLLTYHTMMMIISGMVMVIAMTKLF